MRNARTLAAATIAAAVVLFGGMTVSQLFDAPAAGGAAYAQSGGAVPGKPLGTQSDAEVWRQLRQGMPGQVSIPDRNAAVMIRDATGSTWQKSRDGWLSSFGGWLMLAAIVVLALFFAVRGRIKVEHGMSGRRITRFNGIERFSHWLTASSFVVLGLTGLNMLYGKTVLRPLIGPEAFSWIALNGKIVHDFMSFAFMIGLVLILILWIKENFPNRYDLVWLLKGGGLFTKGTHPPARKFNAGQKILFWLVILTGISISFSGICLLFPFHFTPFSETFALLNVFGFDLPTTLSPVEEMQYAQLWHALLGLVMIAVILGHIYIGWLGMEGAFDAMGTGEVDENWAREHHSVWAAEMGLGPAPHARSSHDE